MANILKQDFQKEQKLFRLRSNVPSAIDLERAARLREVLETLYEANKKNPVIVEGRRDALALRSLGLVGEIIILHRGNNIYEFCEDIMDRFDRVIILVDWDKKGEGLNKTLKTYLNGIYEEYAGFRELLKILCQKDIKDIEGIPKLLKTLEGDEAAGQ